MTPPPASALPGPGGPYRSMLEVEGPPQLSLEAMSFGELYPDSGSASPIDKTQSPTQPKKKAVVRFSETLPNTTHRLSLIWTSQPHPGLCICA